MQIEDWLGDKSEVPLLEGISADFILRKLDDAWLWLQQSRLPESDVRLLCDRLHLRKVWDASRFMRRLLILRQTILHLLKIPLPLDTREVRKLVADARTLLQRMRLQNIAQPRAESPARLAFDARINRRLACFMPTRVIDLPPQEQAWDTLSHFLEGWEELSYMLDVTSVATWEVKCLSIDL